MAIPLEGTDVSIATAEALPASIFNWGDYGCDVSAKFGQFIVFSKL
jgi:hypothetical protein